MRYRETVTLTPAQRAELEDATAETNLLVLASAYVPLKPRWMAPKHIYVGVCPFHYERTGSFTVDAHKNRFYCMSCNVTGNARGFAQMLLEPGAWQQR